MTAGFLGPGVMVGGADPVVTSISPNDGPSIGGTSVTITGSGFIGVTGILFGSLPATSFTVVSSTQIVAAAPPGFGSCTVTVQT